MGNVNTLQNEAQRKTQGSAVSINIHDAKGTELLTNLLCTLKKIELHLSMMTNTVIKDDIND